MERSGEIKKNADYQNEKCVYHSDNQLIGIRQIWFEIVLSLCNTYKKWGRILEALPNQDHSVLACGKG